MPVCKAHKEEVTHMCECRKVLICERCAESHSGFEHTKITVKELGHSYAGHINKQLVQLDDRLGRYSTTTAGKINFITTEYINGMHAMVDDFKKAVTKRYQMIADTFEPFQKIDEKALEMKEIADELAEMDGVPEDIMDKMAACEKNLAEIDNAFGVVGELNEKTEHLEGDIDTDLRDELAEFRDYIEDLFLTFKFPMDYDDTEFYKRQGGLKKKAGKGGGAAYMGMADPKQKQANRMLMENQRYVKGDEDDIEVDIEEEFDVIEGRTYKGHSSWIQDIIRLGSHQFATCDEKGMIVLWNKKQNKQKSISATTAEGDSEAVHCLCTAGKSNEWIVGGCSSGSVFFVNTGSSQKRMVEEFMDDDIFGITSLKQYKGKFVLVQDAQFTIRLFDIEKMIDMSVMTDPKKLSMLEIVQRPKSQDDRQDVYFGDNKLVELRKSNYGKTKKWFSTFVLSCVSTARKINLYVIEMNIQRKIGLFKCKKRYSFNYQFLKSFKFDYAVTSCLELSDDKIAVATGKYIKVMDIKGSKEAGIMFEGHADRIRSLTKITRKVKAYLVRDGKKKKPTIRDAHYIISGGSDMQIRIWKVPVVWPSQKLNVINDAWDPDKEDNCIMAIETKHTDMISAMIYSKEEIITAGKDWNVKMYRIQGARKADEDPPDDQTMLVAPTYADADLNR